MDRVALFGVALALGGCTTFVASEDSGAGTEAASTDSTGQTTLPSGGSNDTNPTSGADSDSGDPGPTAGATNPTTDPTTDPTDPTTDPTTGPTTDPTASSGGDSTGHGSTGADTDDDSDTGEPPESCGDGATQRGESCDDANSNELDGCTSNCELGPTAIAFGAVVSSGLGGGSGTSGISDNTYECPPDEVLVGLQGDLTAEPWIGVIGGICRPAALTNTNPPEFATGAPPTALPEHGGFSGGGPWSTECETNEVIVAVQGGSGTVIDGLQIRCASVDTVGAPEAYDLEPTPEADFEDLEGGKGGGAFGPLACPAGTVASGLRTRTNSYLIQLELRCRGLTLTY